MNFRKLITKNGTMILAGRNAKNNEELISQVGKDEIVLHTKDAGSGFVNIKGKSLRGDIKQAGIFCARYSRDWRDNKKDVEVHRFKGKDIFKKKEMKLGTFGVRKFRRIKVKREWIEKCQ